MLRSTLASWVASKDLARVDIVQAELVHSPFAGQIRHHAGVRSSERSSGRSPSIAGYIRQRQTTRIAASGVAHTRPDLTDGGGASWRFAGGPTGRVDDLEPYP